MNKTVFISLCLYLLLCLIPLSASGQTIDIEDISDKPLSENAENVPNSDVSEAFRALKEKYADLSSDTDALQTTFSGAEISDSEFNAAFRALKAKDQLQFVLAEAPPQPEFNWLKRLMEPIIKFLAFISPVWKFLFWGFLIGGAALILFIIGKAILNIRLARKEREAEAENDAALYRPSHIQARILLDAVDKLAGEGRYAEAVHQLLFRSIQDISLAKPNMIRRSYTSREIANLKALAPETQHAFSFIAREVERSHFGGQSLDEAVFKKCRAAYAQFAIPERSEERLDVPKETLGGTLA